MAAAESQRLPEGRDHAAGLARGEVRAFRGGSHGGPRGRPEGIPRRGGGRRDRWGPSVSTPQPPVHEVPLGEAGLLLFFFETYNEDFFRKPHCGTLIHLPSRKPRKAALKRIADDMAEYARQLRQPQLTLQGAHGLQEALMKLRTSDAWLGSGFRI